MSRNNVLLSCYVVTMVEEPDRVIIPVSTPLGTPVPTVLENSLRVTLTTHTIRTVSVACIRSVASLVCVGGGGGGGAWSFWPYQSFYPSDAPVWYTYHIQYRFV